MVNWISSWVQGIVIAVIISTLIEMILPDSSIKKYVRTVIGVYVVFVIISPIITKITGKEIKISSYELPKIETKETISINTNAYIETEYINKIKKDIIKNIEEKGYKVLEINLDIEDKKDTFGNIKKIKLKISKQELKSDDEKKITVNIGNLTKQQANITEEEIIEIKDFIKNNYGTENIFINEGG